MKFLTPLILALPMVVGCQSFKALRRDLVGRSPQVVASPDLAGANIDRLAIYVPDSNLPKAKGRAYVATMHTALQQGLFSAGVRVCNRLDLEELEHELSLQENLAYLPEGALHILEESGAQALLIAEVTAFEVSNHSHSGYPSVVCELKCRLLSAESAVSLLSADHGIEAYDRFGNADSALTSICKELGAKIGTELR